MNPDKGLLDWARLPGPQKVLAVARRRLEEGGDLAGRPLRVSLTASEREEVGKLLGLSWIHSGRAVSARALAEAIGNLGTDVPGLLAAIGTPVRDLRGARTTAKRGAEAERERAVAVLRDVGVPLDVALAWAARRGLPAAGSGQLADLASRCAHVWERLPGPNAGRILLTVLAASALGDPHAWTAAARSPSASCGSSAMSFRNRPRCGGPSGKSTESTATRCPHAFSS